VRGVREAAEGVRKGARRIGLRREQCWCFGRGNSAPLSLGVSTRASASLRLTPVGGRLSVTIPYEEEGVRGRSDSTQNSTVH
jgi:hypothetical protein